MAGTPISQDRTPYEIDEDLANFIYRVRGDKLSNFFARRAGSTEDAELLLGETFAKAAQLRMKRGDRSATDAEWVDSIARLELSQFLRSGQPSIKAVLALGMRVPRFDEIHVSDPILIAA